MIKDLLKKTIMPLNYIFKKRANENKTITSLYSGTSGRQFSVWKRVIPRKPVRAVKKWQLRDKKRVDRIITWIKKSNRHILGQRKILANFYGSVNKIKKVKIKPLAFFKMSKKRRIRKRYQSLLQKKKKPFLIFTLHAKRSSFFNQKKRKNLKKLPHKLNKNKKMFCLEVNRWKEKKAFLGKLKTWKKVTFSGKGKLSQQLRHLKNVRTPKIRALFQKIQTEENQKDDVAFFIGEKLPKRWMKAYEKIQKIKKNQKPDKFSKKLKTRTISLLKQKKKKTKETSLFSFKN